MKHIIFLIIIIMPTHSLADNICADISPITPQGGERFSEKDFTFENADRSLNYLKSDIPNDIYNSRSIESFTHGAKYYIGYFQSLLIIKGTLLKQKALVSMTKKDINTFCTFLEGTIVID